MNARSPLSQGFDAKPQAAARGFTIVELLVVVAIIILLLSLLIVAMSAGARTAQKTRTASLMNTITKGLVRFKEDVGYYPPVLGVSTTAAPNPPGPFSTADDLRRLYPNSVPVPGSSNYFNHMQAYFSTCTIADYLIGYGHHQQDGYGRVPGLAQTNPKAWWNETPSGGIRHPGDDGAWGSLILGGGVDRRMMWQIGNNPTLASSYEHGPSTASGQPYPVDQGKVLGPYLELKDERLLAAISGYNGNEPILHFPGDPGYTDALPKLIVDYWGKPIRYYRRPYPPGALHQSYRAVGNQYVPTLADVFALRPWTLKPGTDICGERDGSPNQHADCSVPAIVAPGDPTTTQQLLNAEFGLLSSGPDKQWNISIRVDPDEFNKDNLIEVGP